MKEESSNKLSLSLLIFIVVMVGGRTCLNSLKATTGEDVIEQVYADLSEDAQSIGNYEAIWEAFKSQPDARFNARDRAIILAKLFKNADGEDKLKYADVIAPAFKKLFEGLSPDEARARLEKNFNEEEVELLMERIF